uniref:Uncharacterized protein n=1 Tax=Anguilla anguilla TaxID=7936 RepID=A0A0E9P7N6_ANGAN
MQVGDSMIIFLFTKQKRPSCCPVSLSELASSDEPTRH